MFTKILDIKSIQIWYAYVQIWYAYIQIWYAYIQIWYAYVHEFVLLPLDDGEESVADLRHKAWRIRIEKR